MIDNIDPQTIYFYACSQCAQDSIWCANNPTIKKLSPISKWDCSSCGIGFIACDEELYAVKASEMSVRYFVSNPSLYHETWFCNKNFGYYQLLSPSFEILT